jgi:uncharacterized membrane protein YidH (DUF202 family)
MRSNQLSYAPAPWEARTIPLPYGRLISLTQRLGLLATGIVVTALWLEGPAVREVYRHGSAHGALLATALLIAGAAALAMAAALLRYEPVRRLLSSAWLPTATLVVLSVICLVAMPHQTNLHERNPPTARPAMEEPADAILHGHTLYSVHLPGNVPVSPGPLWIIVNAPFSWLHIYALLDPAWLALVILVARRHYGLRLESTAWLLLLCLSPTFVRLLVQGYDIVALACAALLVPALCDWAIPRDRPPTRWAPALAGVGLGVLATGRVIYAPLPILWGLFAVTRSRSAVAAMAGIGSAVAVGAYLLAAIGVRSYPPLHLFARAGQRQPVAILAVGAAIGLALIVVALIRVRPGVASWFLWWAILWIPAHTVIGIGELAGGHWKLAAWEGANYVFAGSIVLAALFASWLGTTWRGASHVPQDRLLGWPGARRSPGGLHTESAD